MDSLSDGFNASHTSAQAGDGTKTATTTQHATMTTTTRDDKITPESGNDMDSNDDNNSIR
jgi:hypothetical protein